MLLQRERCLLRVLVLEEGKGRIIKEQEEQAAYPTNLFPVFACPVSPALPPLLRHPTLAPHKCSPTVRPNERTTNDRRRGLFSFSTKNIFLFCFRFLFFFRLNHAITNCNSSSFPCYTLLPASVQHSVSYPFTCYCYCYWNSVQLDRFRNEIPI